MPRISFEPADLLSYLTRRGKTFCLASDIQRGTQLSKLATANIMSICRLLVIKSDEVDLIVAYWCQATIHGIRFLLHNGADRKRDETVLLEERVSYR